MFYLSPLLKTFQDGCSGITVDDLKDQLTRHEGLLENLTISIGKEKIIITKNLRELWTDNKLHSNHQIGGESLGPAIS